MSTTLTYLLLILLLASPLALLGTMAAISRRNGHLRINLEQFRFGAPMVGPLSSEDADFRRIHHEADAIRTRFEDSPSWPYSGVLGERR